MSHGFWAVPTRNSGLGCSKGGLCDQWIAIYLMDSAIQPSNNWGLTFSCYGPPWGGGTPLDQVYRYVLPERVWFLSRFGQKTGIDFKYFGLKLGMVIRGRS